MNLVNNKGASMSHDSFNKSSCAALIGVLKVFAGAPGRGYDSQAMAEVLNVNHVHAQYALFALCDEGWCAYDIDRDEYYPTAQFWVFCKIVDRHFAQAFNGLDGKTPSTALKLCDQVANAAQVDGVLS